MSLPQLLDPAFVNAYRSRGAPFGWNGLGEFTYKRTYSREDNPEVYGAETWTDTVARVINGMYDLQRLHCEREGRNWDPAKAYSSATEAFDLMHNLKWSAPGRGLWMMGTPFVHERGVVESLNNCAFASSAHLPTEGGDFFAWIMTMLMVGVGVGFDTRGAGKMRVHPNSEQEITYQIGDSREEWGKALADLFDSYSGGKPRIVRWDTSKVRPAGSLIVGFGGIASGPAPLIELLQGVQTIMDRRVNQLIQSRDIVDICNMIGRCVVAGNVRRSAEIALGTPNDPVFPYLKDYEQYPDREAYGWSSNNSILADVGMGYSELAELTWQNGEPGYLWLENARRYGRMNGLREQPEDDVAGVNPCVTADTWIQTTTGPKQVADLLDGAVDIVLNGNKHSSSGFFFTGIKDVVKISTVEGFELRVTEDHKVMTSDGWQEARELSTDSRLVLNQHDAIAWDGEGGSAEEGYLVGLLIGDGSITAEGASLLRVWDKDEGAETVRDLAEEAMRSSFSARRDFSGWSGPYGNGYRQMATAAFSKYVAGLGLSNRNKTVTPAIERQSSEFYAGFLSGLFDADGTVQGHDSSKGIAVSLTTMSYSLAQSVQRMLLRLGILSSIYTSTRVSGFSDIPNDEHRVVASGASAVRFAERVGFANHLKMQKLDSVVWVRGPYKETFEARVSDVSFDGTEEVYDAQVAIVHAFDANGVYTHNCGEMMLAHRENCTLVEIFLNRIDSLHELKRAVKYAYLYGKSVTLSSPQITDSTSREVMLRNRRVGLSMTGVTQFVARHGQKTLARWMNEAYALTDYYDELYSKQWLDVPVSIRRTTVKPSGTVSLLAGSTPGVHYNISSRFHIRRVRVAEDSPLVDVMQRAGYPVESAMHEAKTAIVEFPVDAGPGVRSEEEVPVREQLDLAATMQSNWSDNGVSLTAKFDQQNTDPRAIAGLLDEYQHKMKAISFLPLDGHGYDQAPYEGISEAEYASRAAALSAPHLDHVDDADRLLDRFCDGEACEVVPAG